MGILEEQPWCFSDQIYSLQRWCRSFEPVKDNLRFVTLWVRLPHLPFENGVNRSYLRFCLLQIEWLKLILTLKRYTKASSIEFIWNSVLVNVKNGIQVCQKYLIQASSLIYGCDGQDHQFGSYKLNTKSMSFIIEKLEDSALRPILRALNMMGRQKSKRQPELRFGLERKQMSQVTVDAENELNLYHLDFI